MRQLRTIYATCYSLEASQGFPFPSVPAVLSTDKPLSKTDYQTMTSGVTTVGMSINTNEHSILGDTMMQDLRLGALYNQLILLGNLPPTGFDWFLPLVEFDLPYGAPYETAPGQIIDPLVYASFGEVDPVWSTRATQVKVNGSATVSYASIFLLTNFTIDGMGGYVYGPSHTTALSIEAAAVEFSPTPYLGLPVYYTPGTSP